MKTYLLWFKGKEPKAWGELGELEEDFEAPMFRVGDRLNLFVTVANGDQYEYKVKVAKVDIDIMWHKEGMTGDRVPMLQWVFIKGQNYLKLRIK